MAEFRRPLQQRQLLPLSPPAIVRPLASLEQGERPMASSHEGSKDKVIPRLFSPIKAFDGYGDQDSLTDVLSISRDEHHYAFIRQKLRPIKFPDPVVVHSLIG